MRRPVRSCIAVITVIGIVGCGGASTSDDDLTVFAASSLTDVFDAIGDAYVADHPDREVTFSFAGSSELAAQIIEGAPADVFVSADLANMAKVVDADAIDGEPLVFATNRVAIIVAPGNPLGITGVDDLADAGLVVITCAPEVPCGDYATRVFEAAGVSVSPDSYEQNVKAVVTKVSLGEADAGIAYSTDVVAAGGAVSGIEIPDDVNVRAEYPVAVTVDARAPDAANDFVAFLRSPAGIAVLTDHGFGTP